MNLEDIKANKIFVIVTALIVLGFSYMSFAGMGYWQSANVTHNAGYHGPIPHSGYGVRFYHK
jgi:hypothetical protein